MNPPPPMPLSHGSTTPTASAAAQPPHPPHCRRPARIRAPASAASRCCAATTPRAEITGRFETTQDGLVSIMWLGHRSANSASPMWRAGPLPLRPGSPSDGSALAGELATSSATARREWPPPNLRAVVRVAPPPQAGRGAMQPAQSRFAPTSSRVLFVLIHHRAADRIAAIDARASTPVMYAAWLEHRNMMAFGASSGSEARPSGCRRSVISTCAARQRARGGAGREAGLDRVDADAELGKLDARSLWSAGRAPSSRCNRARRCGASSRARRTRC